MTPVTLGTYSDTTFYFHPVTGVITDGPTLPVPTRAIVPTKVSGGKVFLFGGVHASRELRQ